MSSGAIVASTEQSYIDYLNFSTMTNWQTDLAKKLTAYFQWNDLNKMTTEIQDQTNRTDFESKTEDLVSHYRRQFGLGQDASLEDAGKSLFDAIRSAPEQVTPDMTFTWDDGALYSYTYQFEPHNPDAPSRIRFRTHICKNMVTGDVEEMEVDDLMAG